MPGQRTVDIFGGFNRHILKQRSGRCGAKGCGHHYVPPRKEPRRPLKVFGENRFIESGEENEQRAPAQS